MKNLIIAANWKSNMTKSEAKAWLEEYSLLEIPENIEVVLLAPYTLLDMISNYIKVNDLNLILGSQNVSRYPKGAHTGEIYANQIKELADYSLVGHSERRKTFGETNEVVNNKIEAANSVGLNTIVCIMDLDQVNNLENAETIVAYEPIEAIGTGKPENPEDVQAMINKIKEIRNSKILYGGSINADNVKNYLDLENIDGALVGSASLDIKSFIEIIKNAS